jgi:hypothetical protein
MNAPSSRDCPRPGHQAALRGLICIRSEDRNRWEALRQCLLLLVLLQPVRPAGAMTVNVTYDASVTGLANAAQVEAAFATAAQTFTNLFTNAITINLTVYWGNTGPFVSGIGLGASSTHFMGYYTYGELTNALHNARASAADFSSVASLPNSDPIAGDQWWVPYAQVKALHLPWLDPNTTGEGEDGAVGFASNVSFTFDPANRAVPGEYDFIGAAEHEISEVLGRGYGLDYPTGSGYIPYDLFRFASAGTRSFDPNGTGVFLSIDNGVTALKYFYNNVALGDVQDWASSTPPDAFDAFAPPGYQLLLSTADITALDILGYNMPGATATAPWLTGVLASNGTYKISFTNTPNTSFTLLATTNLTSVMSNWTTLGVATQVSSGHFQYTDALATNKLRFYRVRSP